MKEKLRDRYLATQTKIENYCKSEKFRLLSSVNGISIWYFAQSQQLIRKFSASVKQWNFTFVLWKLWYARLNELHKKISSVQDIVKRVRTEKYHRFLTDCSSMFQRMFINWNDPFGIGWNQFHPTYKYFESDTQYILYRYLAVILYWWFCL